MTLEYISTRGGKGRLGIREALQTGLASDGGLFVPTEFPSFTRSELESLAKKQTLAEVGAALLAPFFVSDARLLTALPTICADAFDFPTPVTPIPNRAGDFILELYHGPTSAFKDVGARFLASTYAAIGGSETRTVIVATSGDTGGAVAAAFYRKPGVQVIILYPKGMVSARQEKQLCAWGENIRAFAVDGTFDDCQQMVKEALQDRDAGRKWLSANSINLGRVLPQMVYYAYASLKRWSVNGGKSPGFIIPSGNLGNSLAALWAKKAGMPIGQIILSLNENRGVADYLRVGVFTPARAKPTLANAMDVGNPSNLERLKNLYPAFSDLTSDIRAESVTDTEISTEIRESEKTWGQALCPHTATAAVVRRRLDSLNNSQSEWILVSTAHPAKFESIVEPLIGHRVALPPALAEILKRPSRMDLIPPNYPALKSALGAESSP